MRTKDSTGWGLPPQIIANLAIRISRLDPQNETERRNKRIYEYAFLDNKNCVAIARINDPLLVALGNRSRGRPLSAESIWAICRAFAPEVVEYRKQKKQSANTKKRLALAKSVRDGEIDKSQCFFCGTWERIELHHIVPLKSGGTNDPDNIISVCYNCHKKLHRVIYNRLD